MPEKVNPYKEYFDHNKTIASVLSLFAGFVFTSMSILLSGLNNKSELLPQATILFLAILFYLTLYALLDNLEMGFHYIEDIPPLTLRVRPFFNVLVIFYLFGTATVLIFMLFGLSNLSLISGVIWAAVVILSLNTTVKRFVKQSTARNWKEEAAKS
jgi:4-hydroxybenzoate polyprenyltransferase